MKHNHISFTLRLPPDLKEQLDAAAEANMRSIHAEILTRLLLTFGPPSLAQLDAFTDGDLVRALMNRYERGEIAIQILPGRSDEK